MEELAVLYAIAKEINATTIRTGFARI